MKKNIYFYSLEFKKQTQLNLFTRTSYKSLKDKVASFVENIKDDEKRYIEDGIIVQLEDVTSDYIFGSYGSYANTEDKNKWIRARDKESKDVKSLDDLIENYTFFFLDLNSYKIAFINNSHVKKFQKGFSAFLLRHFRLTSIYQEINIIPYEDELIENKIVKNKRITKLKLKMKKNKFPANAFASLNEIADIRSDIDDVSITINFSKSSNHDNFQWFQKLLGNKATFDKLIISADDETYDAIEKIISKNVPIEIDDNLPTNIKMEKIQEILQTQLNQFLKEQG